MSRVPVPHSAAVVDSDLVSDDGFGSNSLGIAPRLRRHGTSGCFLSTGSAAASRNSRDGGDLGMALGLPAWQLTADSGVLQNSDCCTGTTGIDDNGASPLRVPAGTDPAPRDSAGPPPPGQPPMTLLGLTAEERALPLPDSPRSDGDCGLPTEPTAEELAAAIVPATNVVPFGTPLRAMTSENQRLVKQARRQARALLRSTRAGGTDGPPPSAARRGAPDPPHPKSSNPRRPSNDHCAPPDSTAASAPRGPQSPVSYPPPPPPPGQPPMTLLGLTAEERALPLPDSPRSDGDCGLPTEPTAEELAAAIVPATNVVPFGTPLRAMSSENQRLVKQARRQARALLRSTRAAGGTSF